MDRIPLDRACKQRALGVMFAIAIVLAGYGTPVSAATSGSLTFQTTWVGNGLPGHGQWVQDDVADAWIAPDGGVYTDSPWDEAGADGALYRDGRMIASAKHMNGWGQYGGRAVAGNATYVWLGMRFDSENGGLVDVGTWPPKGTWWFGVTRRKRSDITQGAPFTGGTGGAGDTLVASFKTIEVVPDGVDASISGLAATETRLFVSDPRGSRIVVLDAATMAQVASFAFTAPGKIAVDKAGDLWIVRTDTNRIVHCSASGAPLGGDIVDAALPTGLAIDSHGRLMVCDSGPDQWIRVYTLSGTPSQTPALASTIGIKGGMIGNGGRVTPLALCGPVGCGTDANGNVYAVCALPTGGTVIRAFTPAGATLWQLHGLEFQKVAAVDPASDDIISARHHYAMDWSKPIGQESSWNGFNLDPLRYPEDPRLHINAYNARIIHLQGHRFLVCDADGQSLSIYRYDGEVAVPSVVISNYASFLDMYHPHGSPNSRFVWRDKNGDGRFSSDEYETDGQASSGWMWSIDANGDVWQGEKSIHHWRMEGLDAIGNPIYDFTASEEIPLPAPLTIIERLHYEPASDSMIVTGYTSARPQTLAYWGMTGTELIRYDAWKGTRAIAYRTPLPYADDWAQQCKGFDVAGNLVFIGVVATSEIKAYDRATGAYKGSLVPEGACAFEGGWLDMTEPLRAHRRANGEYIVLSEEVWKNKILVYRMTNAGDPVPAPPPAPTPPGPAPAPAGGSAPADSGAAEPDGGTHHCGRGTGSALALVLGALAALGAARRMPTRFGSRRRHG